MHVIGIYTKAQNSGKTKLAIDLSLTLALMNKRVALIDTDKENGGANTAFSILNRRPLRDRGFVYCTMEQWPEVLKANKKGFDYAIVDTSKNPSKELSEDLKSDCTAVLIPCVNTEKSIQAASDALNEMSADSLVTAVVPNRVGESTRPIREALKFSGALMLDDMPNDELAYLASSGDLLTDCTFGDEDVAAVVIEHYKALIKSIDAIIGAQ